MLFILFYYHVIRYVLFCYIPEHYGSHYGSICFYKLLEELHHQIGGGSSVVAKTPWISTWANGFVRTFGCI